MVSKRYATCDNGSVTGLRKRDSVTIPAICERCGDIFYDHLCEPCRSAELKHDIRLLTAERDSLRANIHLLTQLLSDRQVSTADDDHSGRWDDGSRRVDWCPPVPDASPVPGGV
jgi:hypothetical protein